MTDHRLPYDTHDRKAKWIFDCLTLTLPDRKIISIAPYQKDLQESAILVENKTIFFGQVLSISYDIITVSGDCIPSQDCRRSQPAPSFFAQIAFLQTGSFVGYKINLDESIVLLPSNPPPPPPPPPPPSSLNFSIGYMLRQGDTFKVGLYNSGMDLTNIVLQYSINQTEWLPVSQHTATVSPITDGVYYYRLHNTVTDVYSNIISHSSPYSNNPIALYSSEPIGAGMFRVTAIGAAIIRALITFVGGSTEERTYQNAVPSDWFGEVLQVTCFIDDANGVRRYGINTL